MKSVYIKAFPNQDQTMNAARNIQIEAKIIKSKLPKYSEYSFYVRPPYEYWTRIYEGKI
tara:strand:- start:5805 stop:5981 length:177 start_codon:yes stop_codon:yes gene_type:complete